MVLAIIAAISDIISLPIQAIGSVFPEFAQTVSQAFSQLLDFIASILG